MAIEAAPAANAFRWTRPDGVVVAATAATLICIAPAIAIFALVFAPERASASFGADLVRDGLIGTLTLMLAGGGGAIVFGSIAAWLVSLCNFPGRRIFEWLLVIPLAAPSYILAYAYASLTWAGGAISIPVTGFWARLSSTAWASILTSTWPLAQRLRANQFPPSKPHAHSELTQCACSGVSHCR